MEPSAGAESSTVVVRLAQDAGGGCRISLEGAGESHEYAVMPFTLTVQLWMPAESSLVRAIVRLHGTRHTTVIQSNRQLVELLQAWLGAETLRSSEADAE